MSEPNTPSEERLDESKQGKTANSQSLKGIIIELIFCVIIPTIILKKLSGDDALGPNLALIVALSLPFSFAIFDFYKKKKIGFVPALGFISILLTGSIGILKLPKEYIAYKEALIPSVIGLAVVLTAYTKSPLVKVIIFNEAFMDTKKVEDAIATNNKENDFDKTMKNATWMVASSFLLSAILNFLLAKWIVVSESGTDAFNSELGTMTLYSYPVIALPCAIITISAMLYVFKQVVTLTELDLEDILHH